MDVFGRYDDVNRKTDPAATKAEKTTKLVYSEAELRKALTTATRQARATEFRIASSFPIARTVELGPDLAGATVTAADGVKVAYSGPPDEPMFRISGDRITVKDVGLVPLDAAQTAVEVAEGAAQVELNHIQFELPEQGCDAKYFDKAVSVTSSEAGSLVVKNSTFTTKTGISVETGASLVNAVIKDNLSVDAADVFTKSAPFVNAGKKPRFQDNRNMSVLVAGAAGGLVAGNIDGNITIGSGASQVIISHNRVPSIDTSASGGSNVIAGNVVTSSSVQDSDTVLGEQTEYAERDLSNLTATAINADLVPTADNGYQLGSSSKRWHDGYFGGRVLLANGNFDAPAIGATTGDQRTGLVFDGVNNTFYFASQGQARANINASRFELNSGVVVHTNLGSASAPGYAFNGDSDSGVFSESNVIGISTAGVERLRVTTSQVVPAVPLVPSAHDTHDIGSDSLRWQDGYFSTLNTTHGVRFGDGSIQRIALANGDKGDITVSANGATWTIDDAAVSYAKIQDVSATSRLLGRKSAGAGDVEEISLGGGLTFSSGNLTINDGDHGDIVVSVGGTPWTIDTSAVTTTKIADDAVTFAKMQNISTDRLLGRDTAASGNVEEIGLDGSINFTGFGSIGITTGGVATAMIANDAVTYAKIQNVSATDKILGRSSSGAGDVEEITCTATGRSILDDTSTGAVRTTLGIDTNDSVVFGSVTTTSVSTFEVGVDVPDGDVVLSGSVGQGVVIANDSGTLRRIRIDSSNNVYTEAYP